MRRLATLTLAAATLAGCSGSGDPVAAGEDWLQAMVDDDAATACEITSPSGVRSVASKYLALPIDAACPEVLDTYADELDAVKAAEILDAGLEAADAVDGGRVGVFPAVAEYQFEVLLMEEIDGSWKVVSVGIPPTGAAEPPG